MQETLLDFTRLISSHIGDSTSTILYKVLESWGLIYEFKFIKTENVSDVISGVNKL